jgi:cytochrome P450
MQSSPEPEQLRFAQPSAPALLKRFPALLRKPLDYFVGLADDYGDNVKLQFGNQAMYLVHDTNLIREVLVDKASAFCKFPSVPSKLGLFGDGLLTSEEPLHMKQRRQMQPAFHQNRIDNYGTIMADCALEMMSRWQDGQEVDIAEEMNRATLEIICRTMFGSSVGQHWRDVAHQLDIIMPMLNNLVLPWGQLQLSLPLPGVQRYFKALARLDEILLGMIEERRKSGQPGEDLLGMLLEMYPDDDPVSSRELRDQITTIFVAGHDTTANGLAWTWHQLGLNPVARADLFGELDSKLAGRIPTAADYRDLTVTQAIVKESMRLRPPVWIMGRRALEPISLSGVQVAKDEVVLVCLYSLHRRPQLWSNPTRFDWRRWQNPPADRWSYLPFGAGGRMCIGERFAWMESVLLIAAVAQTWDFDVLRREIEPLAQLTLRPSGGVPVRLRRRRKS